MGDNVAAPLMYAIRNDDGTYGELHEIGESVEVHADVSDEEIEAYAKALADVPEMSFPIELDDKSYRFWEWIFGIKPKPDQRKHFVWAARRWRKGHPKCRGN